MGFSRNVAFSDDAELGYGEDQTQAKVDLVY